MTTDLLNLGGGGTVPFWIDATGKVYGTTFGSDTFLHVFGWHAGAMSDLGAAYLSSTDLDYQVTSVNANGETAGFIHDAANHIQGVLATGGTQRRVSGLLPGYLAYTQMSSSYGSRVLIKDAGMIACAATDASGLQMALLLSVDADTDNDGLPDGWEMQHYGRLGVGKDDLAEGGGGITNWQAYQQGIDPGDFYNGQAPRLTIVNGDNQTAAHGSFVPAPLVVQLANNLGIPAGGSAVTFSVASGGGRLQAARESSPKTTLSVRTDTSGRAEAFFQTPETSGATPSISTVNATLAAVNLSLPPVFTERGDSGGPVNPAPTDPNYPDGPNGPQDVPAQTYACIDVSGDDTPSDVTMVALNDAGQVTFGYGTGTPVLSFGDYARFAQFHWRTWQNGDLGRDQVIDCCVPAGIVQDHQTYDLFGITVLTGAGEAYGGQCTGSDRPLWYPLNGYMYSPSLGGIFGPPSPPFNNKGEWGASIETASQGGVVAGSMSNGLTLHDDENGNPQFGDVFGAGFVYNDGQFTFFDGESDYSAADTSSVTIVPDTIYPRAVNDKGWVVGTGGITALYTSKYWNGQTMQTLSSDIFVENALGLNNQGQIILGSERSAAREGSLWENGQKTVLVNHVPDALKGKVAHIQPFSISNQTAEGTDATIYILATAKVNGADATIVCTRNNDGDWSFVQIQTPAGTTVTKYFSINSSGSIAFIGNISSSTRSSSSNQTLAQSPSPLQQAGIANPVDISLVFAYSPNPNARDDADFDLSLKRGLQVGDPIITDDQGRLDPNGNVKTYHYSVSGGDGKKFWTVQTSANRKSFVQALETVSYVYCGGHANSGAGLALKNDSRSDDLTANSIKKVDDFMHLRNSKAAIPWREFWQGTNEYPQFDQNAISNSQISVNPINYDIDQSGFSRPIMDATGKRNPERFPNTASAQKNTTYVAANEPFTLHPGGVDSYHLVQYSINDDGSDGGLMPFLIVNLEADPKPKFSYKILVLDVCNGARDYSEVFNHGCFISTDNFVWSNSDCPTDFVDALMDGGSVGEILGKFDTESRREGVFTTKDFSH